MDLATVGKAAIARLDRQPEYYDGLEKRMGFEVRDGRAFLVHCAGVSFRQEVLQKAKGFCTYEATPPVRLKPDPQNDYDPNAVEVHIGTAVDELTGEWSYEMAGFLPKKRCPVCMRSLSGKMASKEVCPDCDAEIGMGSDLEDLSTVNAWVVNALEQGMTVVVGVDNITVPQHTTGNMGLDVWIRIDEPADGPNDI